MAAQVELLAQPDRAERVDAGAVGLALAQQRQAGAAAADLGQQRRRRRLKRRVPAQRLPDRQVDQAALLGLVDDLERDAGAPADPIEEHVAVARLADRAGRHRAHAADAVAVHDSRKPSSAASAASMVCDRITPPEKVSRPSSTPRDASSITRIVPLGVDLGDDQPDRARAHVEDRDQFRPLPMYPSCFSVGAPRRFRVEVPAADNTESLNWKRRV